MGVPTLAVRWLLVPVLVVLLVQSGRRGAEALGRDAYGTLYQFGKEAYLEEDYRSCVSLLLQALQEQREFEQLLLDCRDRCRLEAAGETLLLGGETSDQLAAFERLIRETRCLVQCHRGRLGDHLQKFYDSAWADDEFRDRKPYEYLQLCYYKTGEVQKAANAVFTVLLQQPNNEIMRENFKYYTTMEGVDNTNIVSLEPQEHTELYMRGNDAYEASRWPQVTRLMEEALEGFLEAEQRCRTLCERFFPQGFNPDFVANVANHFAYVLRCKIRCPERLSNVAGNYLSDYLESHFHYLQFAYYKQNMLREACSNVANYLLLKPEDKDMLSNKRLYLKEEGVDESFFAPRPDILELHKRKEREKKLDNYILENFRFGSDEVKKKGDGISQSFDSNIRPSPDERTRRGFNGQPGASGNGQGDLTAGEGASRSDVGVGEGADQGDAGIGEGAGQGDAGIGEGAGQGDAGVGEGADQGDAGIGEGAGQGDAGIGEGAGQGDAGIGEEAGQGDAGIGEEAGQGDAGIGEGAGQGDAGIGEGAGQGDAGIGEEAGQGDAGIGEGAGQGGPARIQGGHQRQTDHADPRKGQDDPGTDHRDPGTGQGDPGSGQGDPGKGQGDSGTGQGDSGSGQGDLGTGQGDPGTGQGDPGSGQGDLRTGQGDPGTGQDDSGSGHGDLGTGQDDPGTDHRDPRTGQGDLGTGQGDPGTGQVGGPPRGPGALLALHSLVMGPESAAPPGPWLGRAVLTSGPAELGGPQRFVSDHLLTRHECRRLIGLLQAVGAVGDGYHKKDPLSKQEEFRGLSFGRLVVSVDKGDASREDLRFMMDVTDAARLLVARRFDVDQLYSSFTHLVSRTRVPDLSVNRSRSELSHAVHVDNCKLFTNGTCLRGGGAYIHRHYSAILYLNDDFGGGEFVFADNIVSRKPTVRVRPRCGRLVGFSAGPENPHGVLAVTSGSRHALAMWYTRTRRQREDERMVADLYLHDSGTPEVRKMVSVLERNFEVADTLLKK